MAATGAEIANAFVTLSVKMPGVKADIDRVLGGSGARDLLNGHGKKMGSVIAGAIGGAVAVAASKAVSLVTSSIGNAVKRVDTLNNFPKIMKNLGYSAGDAEKAIKKISERLTGLPTALDTMAGTVQLLAPLTGSLDEATELSLALNNALLAGGKSTEQQANAMEQYVQMLSLGKVDLTSWRSLVTAMPGQMDQLSVALLGAGNKSMDLYEAMKSGEVSFESFNSAMLKLNSEGIEGFASFEKQARDSTDGIATGFANLQTAVVRNLATVIDKLRPAIDAFIVGATQIANALGPLVGSIIDVAFAVGEWAVANQDWLIPLGIVVGSLIAYGKAVAFIRAVKLAYAAASYGAVAATYASGVASKIGAAAYAIQNSSLVRLIASLRVNEALSLRTKVAIVASTVATKAAAVAQRAWNAVLNANPIGIIITLVLSLVGALTWFFTKTETGQKLWEKFTTFLREAWANVSEFFVTAWTDYIEPVFSGIGDVVTWVWEKVIEPIFNAIGVATAFLGGIIMGLYDVFVKPAIDAIAAIFKWLYKNVIGPIILGIKLYIQAWATVIMWLWTNAVKPALDAIGKAMKWVWDTILRPVITAIWDALKILGGWFKWLYDHVVRPVWDWISSKIKTVWEKGIKPVIDTLVKVIKSDPKKAFEAARDGIGRAWDGIKELAKKPVKFVIETVVNGLIGTLNKIPGVKLSKVALPKGFAGGGVLPGYMSAKRDDVLMPMRSGEGVLVPEVVRGLGPGFVHALNAAGNSGGVSAVRQRFGHIGAGLARGGMVHPLPGSRITTYWMGYPGHKGMDFAKPQGSPMFAAAAGVVNHARYNGGWGNMVQIDHGGGLQTRYAHIMPGGFNVGVGQVVKAGQMIARVGTTGLSTGPHLHYEVVVGGRQVNPLPYVNGARMPSGSEGDGSAYGDMLGLGSWAKNLFEKAFPGGGMWADVAGGAMNAAVQNVIEWGKKKLSFGGPTLFDDGGWLDPGTHLVQNKTRRPEPILTGSQWETMRRASDGGLRPGMRLALRVRDREFDAYVEAVADGSVVRGLGAAFGDSTSRRGVRL